MKANHAWLSCLVVSARKYPPLRYDFFCQAGTVRQHNRVKALTSTNVAPSTFVLVPRLRET
jgi:hypothetical protein